MRDRTEARKRAKELVAKMTLEEKAEQLKFDAPAIPRLGVPAYNWWNEALHGVARAGVATVFPQAIGMAAAFDPDLMKKAGDAIAEEGRAKYNEYSAQGDRVAERQHLPGSQMGQGPRNLRRGSLSDRRAGKVLCGGPPGGRQILKIRGLRQAFCGTFRPGGPAPQI